VERTAGSIVMHCALDSLIKVDFIDYTTSYATRSLQEGNDRSKDSLWRCSKKKVQKVYVICS
jgi:hypothetical protein